MGMFAVGICISAGNGTSTCVEFKTAGTDDGATGTGNAMENSAPQPTQPKGCENPDAAQWAAAGNFLDENYNIDWFNEVGTARFLYSVTLKGVQAVSVTTCYWMIVFVCRVLHTLLARRHTASLRMACGKSSW